MSDSTPNPTKKPYLLENHNDQRIDNYYWLRDDSRKDEKILSYLRSENEYADKWFESAEDYKTGLIDEMVSQVPENETSFPVNNGIYNYYEKTSKSDQLSRYFRKDKYGNEELLLDANLKLLNQEYYSIKSISPSFDNSLMAFSEDNNGRREFTIKIMNTVNMTLMNDEIKATTGTALWSSDNKYIIYLKKDPITLISNSVFAHKVGTFESEDMLLYREDDLEFNLSISLAKSKKYIYINIESTNSNEIRLVDINDPTASPKIFINRKESHLYYLDHIKDNEFYILTNDKSPNFKVLKADLSTNSDLDIMEVVVDHDNDVYINTVIHFKNYLGLEIRYNGLPELSIINLETQERHAIEFDDNAYDVEFAFNNNITEPVFNYSYSSLTTPNSIYSYDLKDSISNLLWEKEILGFDKLNFKDQRFFIEARDGIKVPVITIARSDTDISSAPILFYGYGSYGINIDASFRSTLIPLLNRGFVFSIINIRGGGEMGKHWYEDGRMLNKMNTFNDFNDGVRAVLKIGIGDSKNVFARGGSAGGLLMGAIINIEPNLYKGILSGVPFVDVLTTMSDPSIPLTTFEYDEWGNPAVEDEYFYIKQYSPYDNIRETNYPSVFITSSLYDSQVQYFEPAKYTAKLREFNKSNNPILMKMNLIGGHGGLSGRLNQFNEVSEEYNFILNLVD